ncbi:MAG: Nif3-like dinuclear metal center hexameric protein [Actinomycetota bacterium]
MAVVSQLIEVVEKIAPSYLRYEKDRIGLQVGNPNNLVDRILVTLEVTGEVIQEARDKKVQLIITHHPLIFRSLDRILASDHIGGLVTSLIKYDVSVIAAHTNLDRAREGVSDALAHALGLEDIKVLYPASDVHMFKLVVFVPKEDVQAMISALGNAGGGIIGNYSHCSFRSEGIGTFYPMVGARPHLGKIGELNQVDEYRLEMLVTPDRLDGVIQTMLEVHPYEEVAYDVYEVMNPPAGVGFGRVGNLVEPLTLRNCVALWSEKLGSNLRVLGDWDAKIKRVAVCGGSGGDLIRAAKSAKADVFVTGDVKYHTAHDAKAMGLALIDAGHAETEKLIIPEFAAKIQNQISSLGLEAEVLISEIDTNPWNKEQYGRA